MKLFALLSIAVGCVLLAQCTDVSRDYPRRAEVLFVGSAAEGVEASKYASWLAIELFQSGINLTYTEDLADLNKKGLRVYDGVVLFAVSDSITADQQRVLADFVSDGKGLMSFGTESLVIDGATPAEAKDGTANSVQYLVKGNGRIFHTALGRETETWKQLDFLKSINNAAQWALGDEVMGWVAKLDIPSVSIYEDTIADFTARHFVPKMQDALSPEESSKLIQIPIGFELKLFAAEPDIVNPMAMSWDEKGRLWIIEA